MIRALFKFCILDEFFDRAFDDVFFIDHGSISGGGLLDDTGGGR